MIQFPDESIYLRTVDRDDLPQLREHRNSPCTYKWCRQIGLINEIGHDKWFNRICSDDSIRMYIISRSGLLDTVGICGLTSIDHVGRTAEFSILINSVFRRKGLAGKALKTLLWHGFSDLNLNLIWGETFVGNPAISLYERLGFTKEGTLRERYFKEGAYIDTHVYSIKRDEFIALC